MFLYLEIFKTSIYFCQVITFLLKVIDTNFFLKSLQDSCKFTILIITLALNLENSTLSLLYDWEKKLEQVILKQRWAPMSQAWLLLEDKSIKKGA